MRVLVVGGGGREHAICYKIAQSNKLSKLFCAPGNAGISDLAECVNIGAEDITELKKFAVENNIDYVIVGPENPLVLGLVDELNKAGIKAFGPNKKAAIFEGSKAYSKKFYEKYDIPTAKYQIFTEASEAIKHLEDFDLPVVVKADGLAAGKGVLICQTYDEAEEAITDMMIDSKFGAAGEMVVLEECLTGTEASLLCFVDGKKIIPMESARDYKRAFDNDQGLNTGGMGNFSPNSIYTEDLTKYIKTEILDKTMKGFIEEKIDFRGILFVGVMINCGKAKVLEFNVRFGDPETEVILPRLKSDLLDVMIKTTDGNLSEDDLVWDDRKCVTVVMASGGYPETYEKGYEITGLDQVDDDIMIFHAGTKKISDKIINNGGRVLCVTALGETIEDARKKVYANMPKINFKDSFYRTDIADINKSL